jgi:hypothetical protein
MIDWKKTQYKKILYSIVAIGIVLRIASVGVLGFQNQNTWEYGTIAKNLANDKGYSFYYFDGVNIESEFRKDKSPSPSAYMAPGYVFTLYFFEIISNDDLFKPLVTLFNLILFIITILLLFNFTSWLSNEKTALFSVILYALIPEFIYTTYSLGATQIYHLLIICIFYLALIHKSNNRLYLALVFGVAILFRFEIILLLLLFVFYFLFKKEFKISILLLVIPTLFLAPWVARNYEVFDDFIPTSTTSGLNLFRGNNDVITGGWHNFETLEKVRSYDGDKDMIELYLNEMYTDEAVSYLTDDFGKTAINFGKKFFYFWVLNPNEEESTDILYFVPWFLILSLALIGLYRTKGNSKLLILYFTYHTILAVVFLPLLRYQTMMKIMIIPFAAYGVYQLLNSTKKE